MPVLVPNSVPRHPARRHLPPRSCLPEPLLLVRVSRARRPGIRRIHLDRRGASAINVPLRLPRHARRRTNTARVRRLLLPSLAAGDVGALALCGVCLGAVTGGVRVRVKRVLRLVVLGQVGGFREALELALAGVFLGLDVLMV